MSNRILTDRAVQCLKTDKEQEDFVDKSICCRNGSFGLRVFGTGHRSGFSLSRNTRKKRRRVDLGDYPGVTLAEARQKALDIVFRVGAGEDPAQEKEDYQRAATVEELCRDFLELHCKPNNRATTQYEYTRIIERDVIAVNPCYGMPRKHTEGSRSRYLSYDEIRLLFATLDKEADVTIRNLLKVLLLTGQRLREVTQMRWQERNLNVWTVPAERSKNGRTHRGYLSSVVLELLAELRQHNARLKETSRKDNDGNAFYDELVFPSRYGTSINWVHHTVRDYVASMEIPRWTPHDLRRTAATHMADMGIASEPIEAILNHRPRGIAGVYQRGDRFRECANALERWAQQVRRIMAGEEEEKIVMLRS